VIALHTAVYYGPIAVGNGMRAPAIFNNAERFTVPMFFLLSGYFWADPHKARLELLQKSIAMRKRIFMIFAFWSFFYLFAPIGDSF
jgi:surface polysaccharide O-acyltransferase-like enzyme